MTTACQVSPTAFSHRSTAALSSARSPTHGRLTSRSKASPTHAALSGAASPAAADGTVGTDDGVVPSASSSPSSRRHRRDRQAADARTSAAAANGHGVEEGGDGDVDGGAPSAVHAGDGGAAGDSGPASDSEDSGGARDSNDDTDSGGGGGGGVSPSKGRRGARTSVKSRKGSRLRGAVNKLRGQPKDDSDSDAGSDDGADDGTSELQRELRQRRLVTLWQPRPALSKLEKLQRFRERFKVPLVWKAFLGMSSHEEALRNGAGAVMGVPVPLCARIKMSRACLFCRLVLAWCVCTGRVSAMYKQHTLIWQIMLEKTRSDVANARDGMPCDEMPDFVANHLLFNFGAKSLVQNRLTDLIVTLQEHAPRDRLSYMMVRFCRLADEVPLTGVATVLQALMLVFDGKPPAPPVCSFSKPFEITATLVKCLRAVAAVGAQISLADVRKAQARLTAYTEFGVHGEGRDIEALDAWMALQVSDGLLLLLLLLLRAWCWCCVCLLCCVRVPCVFVDSPVMVLVRLCRRWVRCRHPARPPTRSVRPRRQRQEGVKCASCQPWTAGLTAHPARDCPWTPGHRCHRRLRVL